MSAKFTAQIRTFLASNIIDSLSNFNIRLWQPGLNIYEGDLCYYGNNKYIAKNTGVSGSTAPIHIQDTQSDNGINWIWVEEYNPNKMFKRNMFVFIGKNTVWNLTDTPSIVDISDKENFKTLQNITTLKKIDQNNFRLCIRRYNWTTNTVYSAYDDKKDPLAIIGDTAYEYPFYILTSDNRIYKCIDNNLNSTSTIEPTTISIKQEYTADGYVWKYMGEVDMDDLSFLTNKFIPVKYKVLNDASPQYNVQQAAKPTSISSFIVIDKKGYFNNSVISTIIGGNPITSAKAIITKNGDNSLRQILVDKDYVGYGYDYNEDVFVIIKDINATGQNALITNITVDETGTITNIDFTPGSGFNSSGIGAIVILYDPINIPTDEATINVEIALDGSVEQLIIIDGGNGYSDKVQGWIIPGESGGVGKAIFAPTQGHGANIITELCANVLLVNVKLSEDSNYFLTGEENSFRQVGLITDVVEYGTNNIAYRNTYIGPNHPDYANNTLKRIDNNKGHILYLNNINKVIRVEGQNEDIKIAIIF